MKKSVLFLITFMFMMMQSLSTVAKDKIISEKQLPAAAKAFVQKYFPGQAISYAKIDTDFAKKTYEVRLENGVELEFDKSGAWDKVDCNNTAVPASLVPASIAKYVKSKYAKAVIVKIDKERNGYEVELSNGLDLKFNRKGQLTGIDD